MIFSKNTGLYTENTAVEFRVGVSPSQPSWGEEDTRTDGNGPSERDETMASRGVG